MQKRISADIGWMSLGKVTGVFRDVLILGYSDSLVEMFYFLWVLASNVIVTKYNYSNFGILKKNGILRSVSSDFIIFSIGSICFYIIISSLKTIRTVELEYIFLYLILCVAIWISSSLTMKAEFNGDMRFRSFQSTIINTALVLYTLLFNANIYIYSLILLVLPSIAWIIYGRKNIHYNQANDGLARSTRKEFLYILGALFRGCAKISAFYVALRVGLFAEFFIAYRVAEIGKEGLEVIVLNAVLVNGNNIPMGLIVGTQLASILILLSLSSIYSINLSQFGVVFGYQLDVWLSMMVLLGFSCANDSITNLLSSKFVPDAKIIVFTSIFSSASVILILALAESASGLSVCTAILVGSMVHVFSLSAFCLKR